MIQSYVSAIQATRKRRSRQCWQKQYQSLFGARVSAWLLTPICGTQMVVIYHWNRHLFTSIFERGFSLGLRVCFGLSMIPWNMPHSSRRLGNVNYDTSSFPFFLFLSLSSFFLLCCKINKFIYNWTTNRKRCVLLVITFLLLLSALDGDFWPYLARPSVARLPQVRFGCAMPCLICGRPAIGKKIRYPVR